MIRKVQNLVLGDYVQDKSNLYQYWHSLDECNKIFIAVFFPHSSNKLAKCWSFISYSKSDINSLIWCEIYQYNSVFILFLYVSQLSSFSTNQNDSMQSHGDCPSFTGGGRPQVYLKAQRGTWGWLESTTKSRTSNLRKTCHMGSTQSGESPWERIFTLIAQYWLVPGMDSRAANGIEFMIYGCKE